VAIRCADHATPSIHKSLYYFANKQRSLGRCSSLADQNYGVMLLHVGGFLLCSTCLHYNLLTVGIKRVGVLRLGGNQSALLIPVLHLLIFFASPMYLMLGVNPSRICPFGLHIHRFLQSWSSKAELITVFHICVGLHLFIPPPCGDQCNRFRWYFVIHSFSMFLSS
jgi:hypothetical protein